MRILPSVSTVFALLAAASTAPASSPGFAGQAGAPTTSASQAPVSQYRWPLRPTPSVVKDFQAPAQVWGPGHRGVDLLTQPEADVYAAGAGVVAFSGQIAGRGVVSIQHPNGWRTTYEPVHDALPTGTRVIPGQHLAVVGRASSHCSPRTCLHWGLLIAKDTYRDPLLLLRAQRVILLPLG